MRKYLLLITLLLCSLCSWASIPEAVAKVHNTTFETQQVTVLNKAGCSATAIAPHALITATHCELPTDVLTILGDDNPVHILGRIRDGNDHTIYLVDKTFSEYAEVDLSNELTQGQEIYAFGNPGLWHDILSVGYFAGFAPGPHDSVVALMDMGGYHGDSGEALFNKDGKIVAILTGHMAQVAHDNSDADSIKLMFAWAIQFTPEQIKQAKEFTPPKE